ncbi:RHS repeat-associated core domain-containing protein [Singulisphaera acidiphila]|uniref:RHS repeat-associated core domain protein n=1 Tax=Singulisphaera acidiphila (strain ATCC BAA-1392 / DSM 18658 / VKM B-2454 / MOB10) TaxID=886293 RepID=L0DA66_SINAD|nr:RHS repeat-associated core domain-containing protein [Singulisphaera acidiphila]AGA25728.1 RHS repeat-associated core domain protein [Singulisphaera acidiphila DSM 18658]
MSRRRQKSYQSSFDALEARIVLGYFSSGPIEETPLPTGPTCCPGSPIYSPQPNTGAGPAVATTKPVRSFDGTPLIFTADLQASASPFGQSWGHTRTWSGLNNSGPNGNGWAISELPYIVVAGGTNGASTPGGTPGTGIMPGTGQDDRITVVAGGTTAFTFSIPGTGPYTSYAPWGAEPSKLEYIPNPSPALRLTDPQGNVTEFYDVRRDLNGKPVAGSMAENLAQKYGRFKSYTSANGSTKSTASYDSSGSLTSVTFNDTATGDAGRLSYAYATVTNDLVTAVVGTPAQLLASVTLQRPDGSGSWKAVQRAQYTYYTGRVSNGMGGWQNDLNGRLGDLKLAEIENAIVSGGSTTWYGVESKYYRYYKFTGESNNVTSKGPTNNAATTGGPSPIQPAFGAYNPNAPAASDMLLFSGLKTVIEGESLARLAAAVPGYQAASDTTLMAYVNHFFKYERWADHVGADGNAETFGADSWNSNNNYFLRTGYRMGSRYRVVEEVAQGAGCSACTGGQGTYKYEYAANNFDKTYAYETTAIGYNSIEYNTWRMKTTEFLPNNTTAWGDNDRQIVYTNEVGQALLSVFVDVDRVSLAVMDMQAPLMSSGGAVITLTVPSHPYSTGDRIAITGVLPQLYNGVFTVTRVNANTLRFTLPYNYYGPGIDGSMVVPTPYFDQATVTRVIGEWATYYRYDNQGRLILHAEPSAISGYDDAYSDLLHEVSGNYQYLNDNSGFIQTFSYYTSTTATDIVAGGASGLLKSTYVQRGEVGTQIVQGVMTYYARTTGGATVYQIATDTVFGLDSGTALDFSDRNPRTTSYAYTWFTGTNQVESTTVRLPVISSNQYGPGTADVMTVVNDKYGRPIWTKDGGGFINFIAYDSLTGAVVKTIRDVNTTRTSDFTALPSGWVTPVGGGLHLITRSEVDGLGRTIKEIDPNGNVTYIVFNDAQHEYRIYRGWNATTHTTTGPIEVIREYRPVAGAPAGQQAVYYEVLTTNASPTFNLVTGAPTGQEIINGSNIQSLRRDITNSGGQIIESDVYFSFAGLTYSVSTAQLGAASNNSTTGNYHADIYHYDQRGRLDRVLNPTGTITRTVHDDLGRVVSVWVGTNDTGATDFDPHGAGAPNNMVQVSGYVYDNGGVGDSNLTKATLYPGGGAAARVTDYFYDWRDRLIASKVGVQASEATDVNRPITYLTLNNLGQTIVNEVFDGDGITITDANGDGVPDKPNSSFRRALSTYDYDNQGRLFLSKSYAVDQVTGTDSWIAYLFVGYWYDQRGNIIRHQVPGGLTQEIVYDGAGRKVKIYTSDGRGGSDWDDANTPNFDLVLEQVDYLYDANGNVLLTTTYERSHDDLYPGALSNPVFPHAPRVSYVASYYDALDRPTAVVNLGTNGGSTYLWTSTIPNRSDTALVTSYDYDDAGWLRTVTDPRGIASRTFHDAMGRTTKTIEAYTNGIPTDTTNKTIEYTYNGNGNLVALNVVLPGGGRQTTEYVYGVNTTGGSALVSNNLVAEVRHPDKSTGAASGTEKEVFTYNALGQVKTATDRNGTTHTYTYDVLGRQISDAITTSGSGIDRSVLRLETTYDVAGRPVFLTSYNAASGGSVVNQVLRVYNGFGQLITEYQSHSGAVNTSTTPKVQYGYTASYAIYGRNFSRLTSMTYPDGRILRYGYTVGMDDYISRIGYLADDNGSGGVGIHLEDYKYLGLNTVVSRSRPEPGVSLSYIKRTGESNGDAGDQYTGLDRFGRIIDQRWLNPSTGTATDRFQYGYDRNGNRLYRDNLLDSAMDELYHASGSGNGYDSLNQLTGFVRGALSASTPGGTLDTVSSPSRSQAWDFDALGNWKSVSTNGTSQTRNHNAQNQVTGVGASTLTYDANGNMTTDETGRRFVYDGWNRLMEVKNSNNNLLVDYTYDSLGRRISGDNGTVVHLYYSAQWQMLEERISGVAVAQNVWSPTYVDALVLRDRDVISGLDGILEERLYVQQDANWNVTAITDRTGAVVERYIYDPYGQVNVLASNWSSRGTSAYGWVYLHQGGRYDAGSELYSFRHRDYSSMLGRWTSQDPIRFAAGDVNLYRYVNNSPVLLNDSSGLAPKDKKYGLPDPFWNWYHRQCKKKGDLDATAEEALDLYEEWLDKGKPGPDGKGGRKDRGKGSGGRSGGSYLSILGPIIIDQLIKDKDALADMLQRAPRIGDEVIGGNDDYGRQGADWGPNWVPDDPNEIIGGNDDYGRGADWGEDCGDQRPNLGGHRF